jgi:hypothetical protein
MTSIISHTIVHYRKVPPADRLDPLAKRHSECTDIIIRFRRRDPLSEELVEMSIQPFMPENAGYICEISENCPDHNMTPKSIHLPLPVGKLPLILFRQVDGAPQSEDLKIKSGVSHDSVAKGGELLRVLEAMQRTHLRHIITNNESCFSREYQHTSEWSVSCDEVPQRMDPAIGTTKFMLMAISRVIGFHLPHLMPSHCRFNTQFFMEDAMTFLVHMVFPQRRTRDAPRLSVFVGTLSGPNFCIAHELSHMSSNSREN